MRSMKTSCKQTFIGIWFHDDNLPPSEQGNMKLKLNQTFYYYRIFGNDEDFNQYIDPHRLVAKIFLIVSISDPSILDSLNEMVKLYPDIFVKVYAYLCTTSSISDCVTINKIDDLFAQIDNDTQDFLRKTKSLNCDASYTEPRLVTSYCKDKSPVSLSVFNPKCQRKTPIHHLTKESLHFLCFLTMIDILRRISCYKKEELEEMWTTFRAIYERDQSELDHIDRLAETYDPCHAIKYYTGSSCLSRTINQACHTENMQEIFTFRVYINDLHKQLVESHEQDKKNDLDSLMTVVYRGKPLSGSVLQKLIDNEEGLISMNGFMSTTISDKVASHYHGDNQVKQVREGYRPVLFVFELNTTIKQAYAYVGDCSTKRDELEVLFSLGTIWRIKLISNNEELCKIELTSCDDVDSQLVGLREKYADDECNLSLIGDILLALGDDNTAEWFYDKMLKEDSLNNERRASLYCKIGDIRFDRKDFSIARKHYNEALSLLPSLTHRLAKTDSPRLLYAYDNKPSLLAIYNNMAFIHANDRNFAKAINYYGQALTVETASKSESATIYHNIGRLYFLQGHYEEAQKNHVKAVELIDETHDSWVEFSRNLDNTNQCCERRRKKKQNDPTQTKLMDASAQ